MNYGIPALLKGIKVLQDTQHASRIETLGAKQEMYSELVNSGKLAALHVAEVLREELSRLERGYGTYGKYGVTKDYFPDLSRRNGAAPKLGHSVRDMTRLEEQIAELKGPIDPERLVHEELRSLLDYAHRHGQTEVTTSWLTRSGFAPRQVNQILLAAEGAKD